MKTKTARIWLYFAVVLGMAWLGGCATTPSSRIAANPEVFDRLTPQQQALVKAGQVAIGFEMDTVKLALGDPDRITILTDATGQRQIWHYATYESGGVVLYTGYYQGYYRRGRWGGWWGPDYPYYLDYPNRSVHDHFRVEFRDGRVATVSEETP